MSAVDAGHGSSAIALGLVLDVVFGDVDDREVNDAAVRLEPVFGSRITRKPSRNLAFAASRLLPRLDREVGQLCQDQAAIWLERLHITRFAHLSDHLDIGFDQRLESAVAFLLAAVEQGQPLKEAEQAMESVYRHSYTYLKPFRAERASMALRLARWLGAPMPAPAQFSECAVHYARDGAFVDMARSELFAGDDIAAVSDAFGRIFSRSSKRRESDNKIFAGSLKRWNKLANTDEDVVSVEQFIDRIVAPLAVLSRILLIVLDGVNYAVHRILAANMGQQGWIEIVPEGRVDSPPLIAALPSLTEVSRASPKNSSGLRFVLAGGT